MKPNAPENTTKAESLNFNKAKYWRPLNKKEVVIAFSIAILSYFFRKDKIKKANYTHLQVPFNEVV
jgi:hypothetical protein